MVEAHTVRIAEHALAEAAQKFALPVENHNGVGLGSALKNVDLALRVDRDRGHAPELPAVGHCVGLLAEAYVDAVLHQPAFVRIPSLLAPRGHDESGHGDQCLHLCPPSDTISRRQWTRPALC